MCIVEKRKETETFVLIGMAVAILAVLPVVVASPLVAAAAVLVKSIVRVLLVPCDSFSCTVVSLEIDDFVSNTGKTEDFK